MCPSRNNIWSGNLNVNKASENKLRLAERALDLSMLRITFRDGMTNEWNQKEIKVVDEKEVSQNRNWTGHIARRT